MPKKLFRFIFALLLIFALFTGLTGCEKSYPTAKSSASERRVMAEVGGYKVRYELIRTFFLQNKSSIDGGDENVWTGDESDKYFDRAKELIDEYIREIYGTYLFAKSVGIDPESSAIDDGVMDLVRTQIEGGIINDESFEGYGSKEAYLKALSEMYMTDAANRIILRWNVVQSALSEFYRTTYANGTIEYNNDVLNSYYLSDDCLHFNWVRISKDQPYTDEQLSGLANEAHHVLLACTSESELRNKIALYSITSASSEIDMGLYISPYSYSPAYDELIKTIKETQAGEISEIVETDDAYYIIVGRDKQTSMPDDVKVIDEVSEAYLDNCLYSAMKQYISNVKIEYNSNFEALTPADIIE